MMSWFTRLIAVAAVSLLATGCLGRLAKEEAPKPKIVGFNRGGGSDGTPQEPKLVGRVTMVNEEGKFVLINCDSWVAPPARTALKCMRNGVESGVVTVNSERRGSNVTADIVTGSPQRGDQAFQ